MTWRLPGDRLKRGTIPAMKRFRGRLFSWLAAISLLLCVATVTIGFLTVNRPQSIGIGSDQDTIYLSSWKGWISLDEFSHNAGDSIYPTDSAGMRMAKFVKWHKRHFQLHHWVAALCLAVVPSYWIVVAPKRRREQKRSLAGLCVKCGYDLRATPDRCPECGAVPVRTWSS